MSTRTLKSNSETFWWSRPNRNTLVFDEDGDDRPAPLTGTLSSSMGTSLIDPFRQGVEIQTWKHWTQGLVKIHAGEPGHIVRPENYGLRNTSLIDRVFEDKSGFDPQLFLSASGFTHQTTYLFDSIPPVQLDRPAAIRLLFDGVLDVLDIRNVKSCFNSDIPTEARGVRGAVMAGNLDEESRSDVVTSFIAPVLSSSMIGFKDDPSIFSNRWPNNRRVRDVASVTTFIDRSTFRDEDEAPSDTQIATVLGAASGSGDFIPAGYRASTAGWVYDDGVGTDSIAFGGLTY